MLINRAIERKQQRAIALADVVDRLNAGVILLDSACHIIHSNPAAETILQQSAEVGASLIAHATHGRTGLARWVMGSVAEKVVRMAGREPRAPRH